MRDSAPMCCVSWRKRVREAGRYGFLLGVLEGLRYRVDAPTRALIDDVLRHVKKTKMTILPESPLPPKPRYGSACNGCGLCCHVEVCPAGKIVWPEASAPCPGLLFTGQRTYCQLVLTEQLNPQLPPYIQQGLKIGQGCTMEDSDDET